MMVGGENGVIRLWNIFENKMFGLVLGALAFHMRAVYGLAINPYRPDLMASCSQDGQFAIWSLDKFQLLKYFTVANFLKDIYFVNEMTVRTWGGGNVVYDCLITDGNIVNRIEVNGNVVNAACECYIDTTEERLFFYGGDEQFLDYFDTTIDPREIHRTQAYGEISKMMVSADKKFLIVVTENGIILSYQIFEIKKISKDEYY